MIDLYYKGKWKVYYFFRDLKFAWQQARRGYNESDVWNINFWFIEHIIPLLEEMNSNRQGHPSDMTDLEWEETIQTMLDGFRLYKKYYIDWDGEPLPQDKWIPVAWAKDPPRYVKKRYTFNSKEEEIFQNALTLFHKYFYNLWD